MLALAGNTQFYVCQEAIDLRKSFEGLTAVVGTFFPVEITSGAYFIFLNRSKDRMKVLYWDSDGLAIWYKRLEQGRFARQLVKGQEGIDRREFFMLLEGITPKKLQKRYKST